MQDGRDGIQQRFQAGFGAMFWLFGLGLNLGLNWLEFDNYSERFSLALGVF